MSFLKITDPKRRDAIVQEYLKTKKNIKQQDLNERIGDIEHKHDLTEFFKPVIESQKEVINTLAPQITIPQLLAIAQPPLDQYFLGSTAEKFLRKFASMRDVDKTFGIYDDDGKFYIGKEEVVIKDDRLTIGDRIYEGTEGLWSLITNKKPEDYTEHDFENYSEILHYSSAIRRNNDPEEIVPKASKSWKWKHIIKPIWEKRGRGLFLPRDPNALLERMNLLIASKEAGNTGVRNELVSIIDELYRQKVIDRKLYKKLSLRNRTC